MSVAPERTKEAIYALLTENLPQYDHILAGRAAILRFVNENLRLRFLDGRPVTWTRIYRWSRKFAFPLLPGKASRLPKGRFAAISSQHAVTAWALSRLRNGVPALFAVCLDPLPVVNTHDLAA